MLSAAATNVLSALNAAWRRPGFAALTGVILALGIGTTTAVFSLIDGVLLSPPPYAEPERLVLIEPTDPADRALPARRAWTETEWQSWQQNSRTLQGIAGYRWIFNFLVLDQGSESLEGMLVTENLFEVVGLKPQLGRAFVETDSMASETPPILLGHDLWQRRFDGDPDIVGQTIQLSRFPPLTVIGVMPPDVRFLPSPGVAQEPNYDLHARVDFWAPIPPQMRTQPSWNVVARLAPGATTAAAEAELAVITGRQADSDTALPAVGARVGELAATLNAEGRQILVPLAVAAALVLLIACGNAAALLLIRGLQRQHEFGLRSAIGAGRRRLFAHVISESLVLALIGGGLGVILAFAIIAVFKAIGGNAIPRLDDVSAGWSVLAFGTAAASLACLLAGIVPAWRASRLDPMDSLRGSHARSSGGRGHHRLLGGVVVCQTALTLALLVGAGLLLRTMLNLDGVSAGYNTRNVLTMSVTSMTLDGRDGWTSFHTRALERVGELPGIDGAAFAWGVPLTGNNWPGNGIRVEGYALPDADASLVSAPLRAVTTGYFDLLGQRLVAGRDIRTTDGPGEQGVAIVNQAFVDRYFGDAPALGKQLWLRGPDQPSLQIIGVVSNGRTNDLSRGPEPEIYLSLWQSTAFSKHLVVRAAGAPTSVMADVRRVLREVEPTVAVENMQTLDTIRSDSLASRTFAMRLLVGFAVIASLLTLGGVYSVLALSVAARRRELAIRSAIGAGRRTMLGLVLGQGLRLVAGGVALGVVAAIVLANVLQSLLYEVSGADPATLAAAVGTFVAVALIACWVPARRASLVDPVEALRED